VAVVGVLAEADVGDDVRIGLGGDSPDRLLDDAVLGPGRVPWSSLDSGMPNTITASTPSPGLPRRGDRLGDRHALVARHRLDGGPLVRRGVDEHRRDEVRRRQVRLADERTDAVGPQTTGSASGVHARG